VCVCVIQMYQRKWASLESSIVSFRLEGSAQYSKSKSPTQTKELYERKPEAHYSKLIHHNG